MQAHLQEKVERHDAFWRRIPQKRPLLTFHTGDRFPYDKLEASRALMVPGQVITPDRIDVDAFAEQTAQEIEFHASRHLPGDMLRGVSPFGGIPWMECLLGCGVMAMEHSFVSTPCMAAPGDPQRVGIDESGPWYQKYREFLETYSRRFGDEYPLTETLMRGCLDVYGALIGQEEMVYAFYDSPEIAARMLDRINQAYVDMVRLTLAYSRPIAGGMLHPYGIWAPGTVNQFQEDLCALVTPAQMAEYVIPLHNRMCAQFSYNGMHTHPTSYHVMKEQLGVERLQMVQAQKDEGDPPIYDRLNVLRSIQDAGKCLFFSADLTRDEVDAILEALDLRGLALSISVQTARDAWEMAEHIEEICAKRVGG